MTMRVEELLRQLTGPGYLELDDHSRHEQWQRLRELVRQQLTVQDLTALAAADRVRGQLLLAGQPETFRRFALAELAIRATTRCHWARWRPEGLEIEVTGVLDRPGDPLFETVDGRVLLRVPADSHPTGRHPAERAATEQPDPLVPAEQLDVTSEAVAGSVALVLCEEGNDARSREWPLVSGPGALAFDESHTRLGFDVRTTIDPVQLPSGRWHSYLRITSCGWTVHAPVDLVDAHPPVAVLSDRRFAAPITRPLGLVVSETLPPAALPVARGSSGSTDVRVTRAGGQLRIGLDLALHALADASGTLVPLRLAPENPTGVLAGPGGGPSGPSGPVAPVEATARLVCGSGGIGMLEATLPADRLGRPGRYAFWVDGARLGIDLVLDADGRARALAPPALTVVGDTDREFGDDLEWVPEPGRARGEYLIFGLADADVSDQTLTRLAHYGRQHEAEIVLVRPPEAADPHDRPRTDVVASPDVLGHGVPGTLYARRLLDRVGLDPSMDHPLVFDALAHIHARSIAVLGAASDHLDPRELVRLPRRPLRAGPQWRVPLVELEAAFATLSNRTDPGPRRNVVLERWLDEQLIARLRADALLALDPERRAALVSAVRRMIDTYCPDLVPMLPPVPRMVATLAAFADSPGHPAEGPFPGGGTGVEALLGFAAWERDLRAVEDRDAELDWQDDAVLRISAGFRLEGALSMPTGPAAILLGNTGAAQPLAGMRARLLLCDDHGGVWFATDATVRPRFTSPDRSPTTDDGPTVPSFDLWAAADLGNVAGRTLPPGVWRMRFRVDCLGVIRHLDPTARSVDLPGGERRSRASARFPEQHLALAVGIDVDGSVELLRVPTPYSRTKGPLRRLIRRFSPQRTDTRRNS